MQIGSVRNFGEPTAVRVDGDELVRLDISTDELLAASAWELAARDGERIAIAEADWAPVVANPSKIFCVGLNYREHVAEMGRDIPPAPTYFAKFADALVGAHDDIVLPPTNVSTSIDYEVELCVVVGTAARHVKADAALDHVAGYTILNDVSVRDWQTRTTQFLAGKTFEGLTPVGPVLTTTDELGNARGLLVESILDGEVLQSESTDELIFGIAELVSDISKICTLRPGDLIATGTPSGVGAARTPPRWLEPGTELVTRIEGIGQLQNRCVAS